MKKHHLALIARSYPSDELNIGIRVAYISVLNAFLKYSQFTHIDIFFFQDEFESIQNYFQNLDYNKEIEIRLIPITYIRNCCVSQDYDLFFGLDPIYGKILMDFRNRFSKIKCPVFFLTHTLSTKEIHSDFLDIQTMAIAGDIIFSASHASARVIEKILENNQKWVCLKQAFLGEIVILPLSVDIPVKRLNATDTIRSELGIPSDAIVFGCFSRMNVLLKMELIPTILAFYEFRKQQARASHCYLVLASSNVNQAYYEKLISIIQLLKLEDYVKFYFHVDSEEKKAALYASFDVFISLSDHIQETFGLTLIEAMYYKKPIIASNWNGYKDIVRHDQTGYLIDTYSLDKVSDQCNSPYFPFSSLGELLDIYMYQVQSTAIDIQQCVQCMALLLDREKRNQLGEAAYKRVQTHFSWQVIMPQLWEHFLKSRKLTETNPAAHSLIQPLNHFDVFKIFGHYASQQLKDSTQVRLTDFGKKIIYQEISFEAFNYSSLWGDIFSQTPLLQCILPLLDNWRTVSDTKSQFPTEQADQISLNLVYALKYNLIEVAI